jgi:hypothetical protein
MRWLIMGLRRVFMPFLMDPDVGNQRMTPAGRARDFVNFRKFSPAWRARGARARARKTLQQFVQWLSRI